MMKNLNQPRLNINALNYLRVILLFFISPIVLTTVLYSDIAAALTKHDKVRRGIVARNTNQKKTKQAIEMSHYTFCAFSPFQ